MTTVSIHITTPKPPSPAPSNIATLKHWAQDAGMIADNYSVFKRLVGDPPHPVGQFSLIQVYTLDRDGNFIGSWSANDTAVPISNETMLKIAALQRPDEESTDAKMVWALWYGDESYRWGGVMRSIYPSGARWREATNIQKTNCVFAGQKVQIIDRKIFPSVFWNGVKKDNVPMSRIAEFDGDWTKTHETHPHLIQKITCVDNGDQPIKPKGEIYMPVILRASYIGGSVWVMDRWLDG